MQMPATLIEYVATLDIVIFLGVPVSLLIVVLLQEILAGRVSGGRAALHDLDSCGLPARLVHRGDFIRGNIP